MEKMETLVVSVPNGKMLLQQGRQYQGSFEIFVVTVIKFVAFHMNLRLTKITLSCKVFFIDIYMANFGEVNCIINIYKNAH